MKQISVCFPEVKKKKKSLIIDLDLALGQGWNSAGIDPKFGPGILVEYVCRNCSFPFILEERGGKKSHKTRLMSG